MTSDDDLADLFTVERDRLRAIAHRMLGSTAEADDALQDAWLRARQADRTAIANPAAWLTTVTSRVCLDRLRHRARRPEVSLAAGTETISGTDPEPDDLAVEVESVGRAAFLAAARGGDVDALLALLAPVVVRRADVGAVPAGTALEIRGRRAVVEETRRHGTRARAAAVAQVDGAPGLVVAPGGRLALVLRLAVADGQIGRIDVIADPVRLAALDLAVSDA